ncbi:MAG: methionyl-tRNA formyltransferase [Clostridia bacterium]|nr:methionyl-tRNA formyltransferase [Clostridia bacterium]
MKVLFIGTPDIAATCLQAIIDAGHTVVGAVSQPDRPKGRGHKLQPTPVKVTAEAAGIPVFQPTTLKNGVFDDTVRALAPDVLVVVAFGMILPKSVLDLPPMGAVNVHASLLPRYRGAAPMQRAIMDGEKQTGVTIMYMDEGLDTGDMILSEAWNLTEEDDFGTLHDKTAAVGSSLLCRALSMIEEGNAPRTQQPEEGASYAAKITKDDCILDFSLDAQVLSCRIRGLSPIPLAVTALPDGRLLKIVSARVTDADTVHTADQIGKVVAVSDKGEGYVRIACAKGSIDLIRLRPEGKGGMNAADFLRGRGIALGDKLGQI